MIKNHDLGKAEAAALRENCVEIFRGNDKTNFKAGDRVALRANAAFEGFTRHPGGRLLNLGAFSYCVSGKPSMSHARVGRFCSIAREVEIFDGDHPLYSASTSPYSYGDYFRKTLPESHRHVGPPNPNSGTYGQVTVGHDVWIGAGARIKAGLRIGDGAVIAAGAHVVKDVPPYAIVGGNPAAVIKSRFPDHIVVRFLRARWWDLPIAVVRGLDFANVDRFLDACDDARERRPGDAAYPSFAYRAGAIAAAP